MFEATYMSGYAKLRRLCATGSRAGEAPDRGFTEHQWMSRTANSPC